MTTNGNTTLEDADMADSDGGKVVTMMDVLQEQQEFEEDANAVLGASDDKNCTYTKGYIKRQAIYACLTCCFEAKDDASKRAGVCLACSLTCHENHELIELYTKRNFRCDCGNPKFNSHPCQYTPNKNDQNEENKYNQNFSGLYCVCHRPYPDPEIPEEDEMIQCIICEDWLHSSHLEATVPANDQYSEMICKACMETNNFLHDYCKFAVNIESEDLEISVNDVDCNVTETFQDTVLQEKVVNGSQDVTMTETNEADSLVQEANEVVTSTIEDKGDAKIDNTEEFAKSIQNKTDNATEENNADSENKSPTSKIDEPKSSEVDGNIDTKNQMESQPVRDETNIETDNFKTETKIESSGSEKASEISMTSNENKSDGNETEDISSDSMLNKSTTAESVSTDNIDSDKIIPHELEDTETTHDAMDGKLEAKEASENKDEQDSSQKETKETETAINKSDTLEKDTVSKTIQESSFIKSNDISAIENEATDCPKSDSFGNKSDSITEDIKMSNNSDIKNETVNDNESHKTTNDNKRRLSTEDSTDDMATKKPKLEKQNNCTRPKGVKKIYKGATFWSSDFRQKLCTCNECILMYKALSVLYLIDPEDTVTAYETLGMEKDGTPTSQYEKGLEALSSLDRVQQINALTEYNKMKDKLLDFLKSFKDRKEIVKEEDIKAFFAGMKPKREPDGVYFCR